MVELAGTGVGDFASIRQRVNNNFNSHDWMDKLNVSRKDVSLLQPGHFAIFRIIVNRIASEGSFDGTLSIFTPYETIQVPVSLAVLRGSITTNKLILPKSFPGKIVSGSIIVKSNYTSRLKIKGVFVEPADERFQVKLTDNFIHPGEDNHITVVFDASASCVNKLCYSALDVEKEVGHLWLLGTGLLTDTAYIDRELYKLLRSQRVLLTESDCNPVVNVRLKVDGFGSFMTEVQGKLNWPQLSNKLQITYPAIRIGRSVSKEFLIENPANKSILVQVINLEDYPNSDVLLHLISNDMFHQKWSRSDLEMIHATIRNGRNSSAFVLTNITSNHSASSSAQNNNRIHKWLGVEPNTKSYTMILPPGARQRLTVTFQPTIEGNMTSLLVIRNNLTIVDLITLQGEGGRGSLKIGNAVPNSPGSMLTFEFNEKSLEKKCKMGRLDSSSSKTSGKLSHAMNYFVIKEKFKATNVGRMGMQIRNFLIDGTSCDGFGFHIARCEPIFLGPKQSFDIEIFYSPDFTQTTVVHELSIVVDDDPKNMQSFKLVSNIPKKYLKPCLEALPRPVWENFFYYLLVGMTMFVLLLAVLVAFTDAYRTTRSSTYRQSIRKTSAQSNGTLTNGECSNGHVEVAPVEDKKVSNNAVVANGQAPSSSNSNTNGKHSQSKTRARGKSNKSGNAGASATVSNNNRSSTPRTNIQTTKVEAPKREEIVKPNENVTDSSNHMPRFEPEHKKLERQNSSSSEQSQQSLENNSSTSSSSKVKDVFVQPTVSPSEHVVKSYSDVVSGTKSKQKNEVDKAETFSKVVSKKSSARTGNKHVKNASLGGSDKKLSDKDSGVSSNKSLNDYSDWEIISNDQLIIKERSSTMPGTTSNKPIRKSPTPLDPVPQSRVSPTVSNGTSATAQPRTLTVPPGFAPLKHHAHLANVNKNGVQRGQSLDEMSIKGVEVKQTENKAQNESFNKPAKNKFLLNTPTEFNFPIINSNDVGCGSLFNGNPRVKNIWDSPITTFDTGLLIF